MAESFKWRQEQRQQELLVLAWLTAALMRQKKLPKLNSLLKHEKTSRRISSEERRKELEELKRMFGST